MLRGGWLISHNQGIVGCSPTNVPLWEIPIEALYSGYLWVWISLHELMVHVIVQI